MREGTPMQAPWKIGQAARLTGLSKKALHYYEAVGILPPPPRSEGGYRLYGPEEIRRLMLIKQARVLQLTRDQTRELVELVDAGCCPTVRPGIRALIEEKLRQLDDRLQDLTTLRGALWEFSQKLSAEVNSTACTPETCVPAAGVPVTFFIHGVPKNPHFEAAQGKGGSMASSHDRSGAPRPRSGR